MQFVHSARTDFRRAEPRVAASRRRLLMLASEAELQYRVLRCAAALDADVHVAGPPRARPLALSRYCRAFHDAPDFAHVSEGDSVRAIDAIARTHRIDMVLPSDMATTRLLTRIHPALCVPGFPVPRVGAFEDLATKDRFMGLCARLGLPHPRGALFAGREALQAAIAEKHIAFPAIAKPLDRAGGLGIVRLDAENAASVAAQLDYAPILVQDFIEGEDRCISVFCRDGKVTKEVVYSHPEGIFHFHDEPGLSKIVHRLAKTLRLDGVINFDARIGLDGRVWLIECNPRFFFSMDAILVAGVNFADVGGCPRVARGTRRKVRTPRVTLKNLVRLRRPAQEDWKMLVHWLGDPLMFAFAASGLQTR